MNEGERELEAVQKDLESAAAQATFVSAADGARRRVVYCDDLATGLPLPAVERFVARAVRPFHANAHSAASSAFCARRAAALLAEARALLDAGTVAGLTLSRSERAELTEICASCTAHLQKASPPSSSSSSS